MGLIASMRIEYFMRRRETYKMRRKLVLGANIIKLKDLNGIKASDFMNQLVDDDELMTFVEMTATKISEDQREKIRRITVMLSDLALEVGELAEKYPGNWILEQNATVLVVVATLLSFRVLAA